MSNICSYVLSILYLIDVTAAPQQHHFNMVGDLQVTHEIVAGSTVHREIFWKSDLLVTDIESKRLNCAVCMVTYLHITWTIISIYEFSKYCHHVAETE